ncbi:MAG: hypothetical protein IJD97_04745 [Clostridia bacterium]|nr:hypothetical protein [Clostridia bacterium]
MKKILAIILATLMIFSIPVSAEGEIKLNAADADILSGATINGEILRYSKKDDYFGFKNVDLTGIKHIAIEAKNVVTGGANGDTLMIKTDDPLTGNVTGYLVMDENREDLFKAPVKATEGKHDLYFVSLYGASRGGSDIKKVILSKEDYVRDTKSVQVSDDAVIDLYSDTWAATDSYGRKVADYPEAGAVKTDGRDVGIMYWNWFTSDTAKTRATVIGDVIKASPEARYDYFHKAWDLNSIYYWSEPALGFYDSYDYWVYRKHAEMLSHAGVDVIFFDYTNNGYNFVSSLKVVAEAFRDAKSTGLNVPKISVLGSIVMPNQYSFTQPASIYMSCFVENDYSDIWYYLDGKPLIFANTRKEYAVAQANSKDTAQLSLVDEIHDFFTFRYGGTRDSEVKPNEWFWLEHFPQKLRNPDETGRPEFMAVGCSINTLTNAAMGLGGAASNEYAKGRGFSEVFGEDYTADGARKAYFFREQAALALSAEPEFIYIDGWNEQTAIRFEDWYGNPNAFVDTFDDENSRDFEPSRGALKDDYYNLMVDFIRKYKGVRTVPTASGAKTIDIAGDLSQWNGVGPEFLNADQSYERNSIGYAKAGTDFEPNIYKTKVVNAILSAKVSFDADNFYFLVNCKDDIKEGENFLNLYINTDRMYKTGWEGYDFAVNVDGKGTLSKANGTYFEVMGTAELNIEGKSMTVKIPRSVIGETGTVDFEFKWTDSVSGKEDFMNFYSEGSTAPYGRFNYVYTEIPETSLTESERASLYDTSVIKAGAENMIVSGAKMPVYEKDRNVRAFEEAGTLYIPEDTFNEVMGYGRTKTDYNSFYNVLRTYHFEMNDDLTEAVNYMWTYTTIGTLDAKADGAPVKLSAPVKAVDGIIYIPLSFIAECYGYEVKSFGNGTYTLCMRGTAPKDTVNAVMSHLN